MKLKIMIMALLMVSVGIGSAVNYIPESTMEPGADLTFDGGFARKATIGIYNAKDYGATGDGVTDDYVALQACINASSGNGKAYIPPGEYYKSQQIVLPSNTHIVGAGNATKIIDVGTNGFYANAVSDIIVEDLYLYGNGDTSSGMVIGTVDRIQISRTRIENYGFMGIYGGALSNAAIVGNYVCNNGKDPSLIGQGIHVSESGVIGANSIIIAENICNGNGNAAADYYGGSHGIYISGNESNDQDAVNVIISNNICRFNTGAGIQINKGRETVISDNVVADNRWKGITVSDSSHTMVIGNKITNVSSRNESYSATGHGIYVSTDSNDCIIAGNLINDTNQCGIYAGAGGTLYTNNIINNTGAAGIWLQGTHNATASGNIIRYATNYGIYAINCYDQKICENAIIDVSGEYGAGIYFSTAATRITVSDNNIMTCYFGISSASISTTGFVVENQITDTTIPLGANLISSGVIIRDNIGSLTETPVYVTDGITAPSTIAGVAQIYVDTADGDLKVKFGDGTVAVIAAGT